VVVIDATASSNFAKEQAAFAAATNAPVATLRVSETVEVLGPKGGGQDGGPVENEQGGQSDADEPKKAWWRLW